MTNSQPPRNIRLKNVTKKFGKTAALDNITATIPLGRVYGLIGRNGAGKSTLLTALAGQLNVSGELTIAGEPVVDNLRILDQLILTGADSNFPKDISLRKLVAIADARWDTFDRAYALKLAEDYGLDLGKKISAMSRGQKSLASVVLGLGAQAPLTLLDEPYLGLDVQNRAQFYRHLLEDLQRNPRTVILSTHHIDDAEKILDSIILIEQGKITGIGELDEIRDRVMIVKGSTTAIQAGLDAASVPERAIVADDTAAGSRRLTIDCAEILSDAERTATAFVQAGAHVQAPDLEQAVLALTGRLDLAEVAE